MCCDIECLEILDICSFPSSNNSGYMSLGEIENIVSYNKSGEMYCELSLGKFDF